jgi:hypothetical protein
MTAPNIQHIRLLAEGLQPLVAPAGDYPVFAMLTYGWWDQVMSRFRAPDPVVEVERNVKNSELKIHVGGASSPVRALEPTMSLEGFVEALRGVPSEAASDPILVSMSFQLPDDPTYTFTLNVPTTSVTCRLQARKNRILLFFRADKGRPAPDSALHPTGTAAPAS